MISASVHEIPGIKADLIASRLMMHVFGPDNKNAIENIFRKMALARNR
jgi:hypothetical protein